jgi:superfamily II DNA or RNA helicase
VQRIGRVLRPREGKKAVIYELAVLETTEIDYVKRRHGELEPLEPAPLPSYASAAREPVTTTRRTISILTESTLLQYAGGAR